MSSQLFAITGITGKVGSAAALALLSSGHRVRGIVRNESSKDRWIKAGAEVVVCQFDDAEALTKAFSGVDGAFLMTPPLYQSTDIPTEQKRFREAYFKAVVDAKVPKLVILSSVGAENPTGTGPIVELHQMEELFKPLSNSIPIAVLRPSWFFENWISVLPHVSQTGVLPSPLVVDRKIPCIATVDIGKVAAQVLNESWKGHRIIQLATETHYSALDAAAVFSKALGRKVEVVPIPEDQQVGFFVSVGYSQHAAESNTEMLAAVNSYSKFFSDEFEYAVCTTELEEVVQASLSGQQ